MTKIIQISTLYDKYHEMDFGYVGVDIITGKIKYFSHYDKNDKYDPSMLYEFDINNYGSKNLEWHMRHCSYKRIDFSPDLPKELKTSLDEIIYTHRLYNIKNNYPIDDLEFYSKYLSIQYTYNFSLFGSNNFVARYTPIENIIELTTNQMEWDTLSISGKENVRNSLIHEVGHMKVSKYILDDSSNRLLVKTGLFSNEMILDSYPIANGGIFYTIEGREEDEKSELRRILEEIINEADCYYAFPKYVGNYPKFGKQLNELCDGKLLTARYNGGIDVYYECLKSIINSKDLAVELLEHINESMYGLDQKQAKYKAYTLIKKYQQEKNFKKNF